MFRSKKAKPAVSMPEFFKDWGNAHAEVEALGRRLDSVRGIISDLEAREVPEDHWGMRHWREVEAIVLRKWKHTIRLKDTGLRQRSTMQEGPAIDYNWFERHDGIGGYMFPWMGIFDNWFNHSDLDASWANAQEQKLQKARQGLA